MINYANRLPPGKPVELLDNGLIRKTGMAHHYEHMEILDAVLKHFIKHPAPNVVPVYDYQVTKKDNAYHYYYDMMRCGILPRNQRNFVDLFRGRYELYHNEIFSGDKESLLFGHNQFPLLFDWLKGIALENRYWDIHSGNVMFNEDGEYVLIDLEGFVWARPLSNEKNNWISKTEKLI